MCLETPDGASEVITVSQEPFPLFHWSSTRLEAEAHATTSGNDAASTMFTLAKSPHFTVCGVPATSHLFLSKVLYAST